MSSGADAEWTAGGELGPLSLRREWQRLRWVAKLER